MKENLGKRLSLTEHKDVVITQNGSFLLSVKNKELDSVFFCFRGLTASLCRHVFGQKRQNHALRAVFASQTSVTWRLLTVNPAPPKKRFCDSHGVRKRDVFGKILHVKHKEVIITNNGIGIFIMILFVFSVDRGSGRNEEYSCRD